MAKTVDQYFDELQQTRIWRSIFRSGTGSSTLKRALAIQQNVFLHLFSTKVRTRMLSFSATWYLGTLTLGTFLILVATCIPGPRTPWSFWSSRTCSKSFIAELTAPRASSTG